VSFAGFSDPALSLTDALTSLQDIYDITLSVDVRAFRFAGISDVCALRIARTPLPPMRAVPLRDVLRAVIVRIAPDATLFCDGADIVITTHCFALGKARAALSDFLTEYADAVRHNGRTDPHLYGSKAVELLWAACYWHQVVSENAKALLAEKAAAPCFPGLAVP
jgi:hypothetical protein